MILQIEFFDKAKEFLTLLIRNREFLGDDEETSTGSIVDRGRNIRKR